VSTLVIMNLERALEGIHEFRRQFHVGFIGILGIFGEVGGGGLEYPLRQSLRGFPGVEWVRVVLCVCIILGGKQEEEYVGRGVKEKEWTAVRVEARRLRHAYALAKRKPHTHRCTHAMHESEN